MSDIIFPSYRTGSELTVGVTRWWAGVEYAWERENLHATVRKMLENRAVLYQLGACCVAQIADSDSQLYFNTYPFQ
jgi:hypothetical protein